ncbi:MAG TPA: NYN domain-containing protein [Candidatus Peribacteraceae bacterium]|nr:NYN domain-containing protein [Candidatus Peribacteraceae bacterium]
MKKRSYNRRTKPTALPPETARRQFFDTSSRKKKIIVFIDGSNWYHKLKALLGTPPPIEYDVKNFAKGLAKDETVSEIRYYIGRIRRIQGDEKSELLYSNQQKLLRFLQKQKVKIGLGHLISYPDGSFHEKGVDILIAVEMMRCVIEKKCDTLYLVSSDTDLVPAVDECRRLGAEVVYVGSSSHGPSFGLKKACNRSILLRSEDVLPFIPKK